MKEKQNHKSEGMRDSGLSARHGCTGCGNSQAFYPHVCLCCRCRCCCRALLPALLVLHCLGCPGSTAYSRRGPKWYDVRIFTLATTAVPCAEKLDSSDVCVCVDKRGDSRLLKPLNPNLTYLRCVPRPQRHNGRVCALSSRVVVTYVEGDGNQSPLGLRLPTP